MGKEKNILCPKCRRKVGKHDGKSMIIKTIKCKYCEAFVVYNPITDKTTKGKEIERWASSGKRFY